MDEILFKLEQANDKAKVNIACEQVLDNVRIYKIMVSTENVAQPTTLRFARKMCDIYSTWQPLADRKRWVPQWMRCYSIDSQLYCGAPVFSAIRQNGKNNITIALSDTVCRSSIEFGVNDFEEKEQVEFIITLYGDSENNAKEYIVYLRIDEREIAFDKAIKDVSKWYQQELQIKHTIPDSAATPLYSSWYNFHQNPQQDLLLKELKEAKALGFETVIIDDGWSYDGTGTGNYINCGDWTVSEKKFPDLKDFVNQVHSLGMKVMLWFPVPFVGYNTQDYKKFSNMLLYNHEKEKAGVLDVRYKEVRDYIVNLYKCFVQDYSLDGLKLDFIDSFMLKPESPVYNMNMDCETVTKGVLTLLQTINQELSQQKEDFLIEFRQNYVGAEIVRYCNMLRVADCAYDSITNRIAIADLRLLHTDIAIHSDMLLWASTETVEQCAKQLLNVMFSVPQISVLLTKVPEEQKELIASFIKYWTENKCVLLGGDLQVERPEANYTKISSETENKKITVLYSDNYYEYTGKEEDVFNNTEKDVICVENKNGHLLKIQVFNALGTCIYQDDSKQDIMKITVPVCGRVHLQ